MSAHMLTQPFSMYAVCTEYHAYVSCLRSPATSLRYAVAGAGGFSAMPAPVTNHAVLRIPRPRGKRAMCVGGGGVDRVCFSCASLFVKLLY